MLVVVPRVVAVDEFDRLAVAVASELLRSEAESPGSQDATLLKLAEAVLNNVRIPPDEGAGTVSTTSERVPGRIEPDPIGISRVDPSPRVA